MGVKRVVLDENGKTAKSKRQKKKKNYCCSCILGFVITVAVILVAGVGVGWYFGDQFTRKNFDMSLGECFSVVSGLYSPKEKKIVTNGYDESDLDGFYTELKHAIFLKTGTDVSVEKIYETMSKTDNAGVSYLSRALNAARSDGEQVGDGELGGGGQIGEEETGEEADGESNAIMNYIAALFTKENVDFERLESYDREQHEAYLLNITDKGLAAFVDKLLVMTVGKDSAVGQQVANYGIDDLSKYLSVRQIIMSKQNRTVTLENEDGESTTEEREVSMISFTVHVKLTDMLKPAMKKVIENSFLSSLAHFAVKVLLPNNVYLTVGMGLDYDAGLDIRINNIDNEQKAAKAMKLINGIMSMSGSEKNVESFINDMLKSSVRPVLDKADAFADFSAMTNGKMTVDPFGMVIELAALNEGAETEDDIITSADLLSTLSSVATGDYADGISPEHTHHNQFKTDAEDGGKQYSDKYQSYYDPVRVTADNLIDYRDEFLKEMSVKYLITLDPDGVPDSGDEIEFNDFMALFGIGTSDNSLNLMQLIDGKRMEELLGEEDASKLKVEINDRMMGAIVSAAIDSVLGDSAFAEYDLRVEQVILRKSDVSEVGAPERDWRNFIEVGISVSTASMVASLDGNPVGAIATAFLPERVMLSLDIDITRGLEDDGKQPIPTVIKYNDLDETETDDVLKVIGKLVKSLQIESLLEQLESPMREMIDKMCSVIPSVEFGESKVVMPDIFTSMSEMMFAETDEESGEKTAVVSGGEIRYMLKGMVGTGDDDYVESALGAAAASENYDGFTSQIKDKYYIKSSQQANTFQEIFSIVDMTAFDSEKFDLDALKRDNRDASELSPMITDAELAHIFEEAMGDNESLGNMAKIAGIHVGTENAGASDERRYIKLVIELDLSGGLGEDISSVLPSDVVYIVAVSYVDEVLTADDGNGEYGYYDTVINVNEMDETQKDILQRMIRHMQGEGAMDFDEQALEIGKLIYEQFATLSDSLGEDGYEFTDGGIRLVDFYSFLARATELDKSEEYARGDYGSDKAEIAENIKGAIQGLYKAEDGADNSKYNYAESGIVTNRIASDLSLDNIDDWFDGDVTLSPQGNPQGVMVDKNFGAFIADRFGANGGRLVELTVISRETRTVAPEKIARYLEEMAAYGVTDANKEYMRLVIEMNFGDLMGGDTSIGSFLPADGKVFATVYIEVEPDSESNQMRAAIVRINSMTAMQQAVMLKIAGLDDGKLNESVEESLTAVEEYMTAEYRNASREDCIGAMYAAFDFASKS